MWEKIAGFVLRNRLWLVIALVVITALMLFQASKVELTYENPKFVEDMVRDVAARLNEDDRIVSYIAESENFESIHNHSAYALIEKDKTKD